MVINNQSFHLPKSVVSSHCIAQDFCNIQSFHLPKSVASSHCIAQDFCNIQSFHLPKSVASSHFPLPTSHFLLTSYFILHTSYFFLVFPAPIFHFFADAQPAFIPVSADVAVRNRFLDFASVFADVRATHSVCAFAKVGHKVWVVEREIVRTYVVQHEAAYARSVYD